MEEQGNIHRSGFVNIIGRPNAGKSTLMNALVGEKMSIITHKPQTTRHRIIGIVSEEDFQIVFSDTPGIIDDPSYKLQRSMNAQVEGTFEDADIMLFVTAADEEWTREDPIIDKLSRVEVPLFLLFNKSDTINEEQLQKRLKEWQSWVLFTEVIPISALKKTNLDRLINKIQSHLPIGPVYYPKDQLTDKPERFFISEIIREKILLLYHQEIPYSVEIVVNSFKETETKSGEPLVRIAVEIYASRKTQKSIIIGKGGSAIKKLSTEARKDMEAWLEKKVFLELFVKVRDNWRDDDRQLKYFGY